MGINLRTKPVSEMGMLELPYNDCYVKDRQAMYRDYDTDMSARGLDGIMAMLYQQIWTKAEMREVLLKISEIYDITEFI